MDIIPEKLINRHDVPTGVHHTTHETAEELTSHLRPLSRSHDTAGHANDDTNSRSSTRSLQAEDKSFDPEQVTTNPDEDGSTTIYIDFTERDKRDPKQFSKSKKWVITIVACAFSVLVSMNISSYALGFPSMEIDLDCTPFQAAIGLSTYGLGLAVVPLVSASFGEEFGRQPLYVVSIIGFSLTHLMIALSKNIQTVIVARFFSGGFASTASTLVGGTIADIWSPEERGFPMSIHSLSIIGSNGIGAFMAGWIEQNPHLQWRWIQWISLTLSGALSVAIPIFMKETRSTVLLVRIAKKTRKETGDQRYRARVEDELPSLRVLLWISLTRPVYLMLTEPIVISFALWGGFAWGIMYGLVESVGPVYTKLHNFNSAEIGSVYISLTVGSILGYLSNLYQERLYRRTVQIRGPEARLYVVCFTAWLVPIGMFIFGWTAFPFVHWIAPLIGIVLFMWALYSIFWTGFIYLADVYGPYASSAIAGQSLSRNIMATMFPLITEKMLSTLGYNWSNTIFALLALAMAAVPTVEYHHAFRFVLFFYGPKIRSKSKFASRVVHDF